jgi:hypothetical protein
MILTFNIKKITAPSYYALLDIEGNIIKEDPSDNSNGIRYCGIGEVLIPVTGFDGKILCSTIDGDSEEEVLSNIEKFKIDFNSNIKIELKNYTGLVKYFKNDILVEETVSDIKRELHVLGFQDFCCINGKEKLEVRLFTKHEDNYQYLNKAYMVATTNEDKINGIGTVDLLMQIGNTQGFLCAVQQGVQISIDDGTIDKRTYNLE